MKIVWFVVGVAVSGLVAFFKKSGTYMFCMDFFYRMIEKFFRKVENSFINRVR